MSIKPDELELEIEFEGDAEAVSLHFHVHCFSALELELQNLERATAAGERPLQSVSGGCQEDA